MTDPSSSKSSSTGPWASFWFDAQRQYWESWRDVSRRIYGAQPSEAGKAPINPWEQALEFWSGLIATPRGRREAAAPIGEAAADSAFGPWVDVWIKAQHSGWDAWFEATRGFAGPMGGQADTDTDPWSRVLDFWTTLLLPMLPAQSRDGVHALLEANRVYFEDAWRILAGSYGLAQGAEHPWEAFSRGLRQMQDDFTEHLRAGRNPWAGFATFWGMPLDNWRRVCSAFSVLPGDMEKAVREVGSPYGTENLHRTLVGFLSMPTVGYTREWQEELQRWGLLWLNHFETQQAYGAVLVRITQRAFELFAKALSGKSAGGEALGSLRAFYDLWIDCAEDAYAEVSVSPEFVEIQSRLTNSLFAIKRQEQKMVEEIQSAFNMPTRRELDTSHRRVHQLQRRLWQLEQALEEAGGPELREDVSALRREVDALRTSVESGGAKPTPPRKSGLKPTT